MVKDGGRYFLFYSGGPSGPANGADFVRYQIGLALSGDGVRFEKTGKPLLPLGVRDDFHATPTLLRDPDGALRKEDGLWHMIYCGNRADDVEHAVSGDGISWKKANSEPLYRRAYAPSVVRTGGKFRMYYVAKPGSDGNGPRSRGRFILPWERICTA